MSPDYITLNAELPSPLFKMISKHLDALNSIHVILDCTGLAKNYMSTKRYDKKKFETTITYPELLIRCKSLRRNNRS